MAHVQSMAAAAFVPPNAGQGQGQAAGQQQAEINQNWGVLKEPKQLDHIPWVGTAGIQYESVYNLSKKQRLELKCRQCTALYWFEWFVDDDFVSHIISESNLYVN